MSVWMTILLALTAALLPSLLWLWFFLSKDRYDPEPRSMVAKAFLLGMAMVPVALFIENRAMELGKCWFPPVGIPNVLFAIFVVAPVEELLKSFIVWTWFYPDPEFNEPMDGIVYATTTGIGFAMLENALYMLRMGVQVIVLRSVVSTLLHVGCTGMVGYGLGRAKFNPKRKRLVGRMLVTAIVVHGWFDVLISYGSKELPWSLHLGTIATLVALLFWLYSRLDMEIDDSLRHSPFRPKRHPHKSRHRHRHHKVQPEGRSSQSAAQGSAEWDSESILTKEGRAEVTTSEHPQGGYLRYEDDDPDGPHDGPHGSTDPGGGRDQRPG